MLYQVARHAECHRLLFPPTGPSPVRLMVMVCETAVREEALTILYRLRCTGRLGLVSVEEVHVLLLQSKFRPSVHMLANIASGVAAAYKGPHDCQPSVIVSSGTLPRCLQPAVLRMTGLAEDCAVVRATTSLRRDHLAFFVHQLGTTEAADKRLLSILEEWVTTAAAQETSLAHITWPSHSLALRATQWLQAVFPECKVLCFTAKMTLAARRQSMEGFHSNHKCCLFNATTAAIEGLDSKACTLSVVMYAQYSLCNVVQAGNRSHRHTTSGCVHVVYVAAHQGSLPAQEGVDNWDLALRAVEELDDPGQAWQARQAVTPAGVEFLCADACQLPPQAQVHIDARTRQCFAATKCRNRRLYLVFDHALNEGCSEEFLCASVDCVEPIQCDICGPARRWPDARTDKMPSYQDIDQGVCWLRLSTTESSHRGVCQSTNVWRPEIPVEIRPTTSTGMCRPRHRLWPSTPSYITPGLGSSLSHRRALLVGWTSVAVATAVLPA